MTPTTIAGYVEAFYQYNVNQLSNLISDPGKLQRRSRP
jgi:hypothetical protein